MNLRNIDPALEKSFLVRIASTNELPLIAEKIKPEYFANAKIRDCVQACINCLLSGDQVNPVNISAHLREVQSRVDSSELLDLIEGDLTDTTAAEMLESVKEIFTRRELEILGRQLSAGNLIDPMSYAQSRVLEISTDIVNKNADSITDLIPEQIEGIGERIKANREGTKPEGILFCGLPEFDKLYPFQGGDLVIIAARPSMGKTSLAKTWTRNMARQNAPIFFVSIEVSKKRITNQMICLEAQLNSNKVRSGSLEDFEHKQYIDAAHKVANLPITIGESSNLVEILSDVRKWRIKNPHNTGAIFIDYLQLIQNPMKGRNREQEVSAASRALKELAKELNCVVFCLSQLSRAVESRGGDKRPMLSDLRESGAIEQDADTVIFPYRPEYYGFETDDEGNPTQGLAELIVAKGRNMGTFTAKAQFVGKYGEFLPWMAGIFPDDETGINGISLPDNGKWV